MSSPEPLCGALVGFILVRFLIFWIIANRFPNHRTAWTLRPEYSVLHKKEINEDLPKAYAAYSKNEFLRKESSSGGIFSELAKEIIKSRGIVFGAAYNEDFKVVHIPVDNINDLGKLRGAKYSQSDLNNSLVDVKYFLEQRRQVLFSVTTCQVAGLKAF